MSPTGNTIVLLPSSIPGCRDAMLGILFVSFPTDGLVKLKQLDDISSLCNIMIISALSLPSFTR